VRLCGEQAGVDVGGFPAAAWWPAQRRAVRGLTLAEQQVIGFALDHLARLEAEGFRARAPPAAGRLTAALAGLDVVLGRVLSGLALKFVGGSWWSGCQGVGLVVGVDPA
jgi:hypothetical protein